MPKKANFIIGAIVAVFGLGILLHEVSIVNGNVPGYHLAPGVSPAEAYMLPISIIAVGLIVILFGLRKAKQEKEEEKRKTITEKKRIEEEEKKHKGIRTGDEQLVVQFYRNCVSEGIKNVNTSSNIERLMLYVKREKIEGNRDELIAAFRKGEAIANKADTEARAKQMLENEEDKRREDMQYLHYSGREKLVKILNDKIRKEDAIIAECERQIDSIRKGGSSLYQKERDWAVAGGIATGIAGSGAGLATAIDTQRKNAGIRQSNEAVASLMYNSISQVNKKKITARNNKEKWERILKKAEICLIEDNRDRDYLKYVDISVEGKEFSESGNVIVTIRIKRSKPFTIFEDVPAVVDGSIKVCLTSNGKTVGEGYYVFPFYGSGTRSESYTERVICHGNDVPDFYDVKIIANHLWGLEKLDFFS